MQDQPLFSKNKNHRCRRWIETKNYFYLIKFLPFFFLQLHHPSQNARFWGQQNMDRQSIWPAFLMRAPQSPDIPGKASMYKMSPVYCKRRKVWGIERHKVFELSVNQGWKDFERQIQKHT